MKVYEVTADIFEELPDLIRPIVEKHPRLREWGGGQNSDGTWTVRSSEGSPALPKLYSVPHVAPVRRQRQARTRWQAPPPPRLDDSEALEVMRRRVARLERELAELREAQDPRYEGVEREYREFMDQVGWTERIELLS